MVSLINDTTLDYKESYNIKILQSQIKEAKEKLAILLDEEGKVKKYSPKIKISEKIPFSENVQSSILSLESEVISNQGKLLNILDQENKYTKLIDILIKAKEQQLIVREWNKAVILSETADLLIPFWWSSIVSLPITGGSYIALKKFKAFLESFYQELEKHNNIDKVEHINTFIKTVAILDILETLAEGLSMVTMKSQAINIPLSGIKIGFSLRNKKQIGKIGTELNDVVNFLIGLLEQEKKTLAIAQES